MKKLFSIFLLTVIAGFSINTEKGACQWVQVLNGTATFSTIVTNSQVIIAGSSGSGFFRSTNNGANWTQYLSLIDDQVKALVIKDNILFAGTYINGVQKSTNFGLNWSSSYAVNSGSYLIKHDSSVYYGTNATGVHKTTNNGVSWVQMGLTGLPSNKNIYSMTADSIFLFIGDATNGIYRTLNTGGNWTAVNSGISSGPVYGMDSYNKLIFAVVSGTPTQVFRSSNYGTNWILKTNGITGGQDAMCIAHYGSTLMLGLWNGFYVSQDSGNTWIDRTGNLSGQSITSITTNGEYVFIGTYNPGKVWRRPLSQIVSVYNVISNNTPEKFLLGQNYPNPFNAISKIKYSIRKNSDVRIIVYDITGRIAETLIDEKQNAGEYELKFDGNLFSSGIYFYSLYADNVKIDTKKMVMIK